jgi:hypothetical protein
MPSEGPEGPKRGGRFVVERRLVEGDPLTEARGLEQSLRMVEAYPSWVLTAEDAKEALAAIPEGGLPAFHQFVDGQIGHAYHLAGRLDGAMPYLERGANGCYALFSPFAYYEANLFYGRALEEKKDTDRAWLEHV